MFCSYNFWRIAYTCCLQIAYNTHAHTQTQTHTLTHTHNLFIYCVQGTWSPPLPRFQGQHLMANMLVFDGVVSCLFLNKINRNTDNCAGQLMWLIQFYLLAPHHQPNPSCLWQLLPSALWQCQDSAGKIQDALLSPPLSQSRSSSALATSFSILRVAHSASHTPPPFPQPSGVPELPLQRFSFLYGREYWKSGNWLYLQPLRQSISRGKQAFLLYRRQMIPR